VFCGCENVDGNAFVAHIVAIAESASFAAP
jgi:hypothetical protein